MMRVANHTHQGGGPANMNAIRSVTSTPVRNRNRLRLRFIAFCTEFAQFPGYTIDRERLHGGWRYVARPRHAGMDPKPIEAVTLDDLRPKLERSRMMAPVNRHIPSAARVYDCLLGGKDNFQADQDLAEMITIVEPRVPGNARANKEFVSRAVTWVAEQGVTQFMDLGSGIPTVPRDADGHPSATWLPTHVAAQEIQPGARVAYVDHDPVVLTHSRAFLAQGVKGVEVFQGDLREPEKIWASTGDLVNLNEPVCLITALVYHFMPADQAREVASEYTRCLPPGSYVVISVSHGDREVGEKFAKVYNTPGGPTFHNHTRAHIAGLFDGLELQGPGIVDVARWRPGWGESASQPARGMMVLAGVGRKALRSSLLCGPLVHGGNPGPPVVQKGSGLVVGGLNQGPPSTSPTA